MKSLTVAAAIGSNINFQRQQDYSQCCKKDERGSRAGMGNNEHQQDHTQLFETPEQIINT